MTDFFDKAQKKTQDIHAFFVKTGQTLAVAESCTGGLLSHSLTIRPGAGRFFLGSVVSYSYPAKTAVLGVPAELLKKKGAVNKEVCQAMAQGIKKKWFSDWALSVTGVAGPDKNPEDPPIGTVFVGLLGPEGRWVERFLSGGKNRQDIQHQSTIFALDFLRSRITMGGPKKRRGI